MKMAASILMKLCFIEDFSKIKLRLFFFVNAKILNPGIKMAALILMKLSFMSAELFKDNFNFFIQESQNLNGYTDFDEIFIYR